MKKSIVVGILSLVGLLTVRGAQLSGPALTKETARDIIESTDNYKPRKWPLPLAKADADACVARGYLRWDSFGPAGKGGSTVLTVTDAGKQFFDSASGGKTQGSKQSEPLFAVVAVPIKPQVIEVTNITDGDGGTKVVEYRWNWDAKSQPQEVQDLLLKNQTTSPGKVVVKMEADGWKVVKFQ
jgi:hypothetical protein